MGVIISPPRLNIEEFEAFVELPENQDKLFELIGGEIVEVPSNTYSSYIAANILTYIKLHTLENQIEAYVTGENGGYMVYGERYAPDVAYISKARQPELAKTGYNPNPPELAVEVVSPTDQQRHITIKVGNYLAAGTIVWVVYPDEQEIQVFIPQKPVQTLTIEDILTGGDLLPDFSLPLRKIFA